MIHILYVQVNPKVLKEIQKRWLEKQFDKAIRYILSWQQFQSQLKLRQPTSDGVRYFRINKQYRALCTRSDHTLYVDILDNHQ